MPSSWVGSTPRHQATPCSRYDGKAMSLGRIARPAPICAASWPSSGTQMLSWPCRCSALPSRSNRRTSTMSRYKPRNSSAGHLERESPRAAVNVPSGESNWTRSSPWLVARRPAITSDGVGWPRSPAAPRAAASPAVVGLVRIGAPGDRVQRLPCELLTRSDPAPGIAGRRHRRGLRSAVSRPRAPSAVTVAVERGPAVDRTPRAGTGRLRRSRRRACVPRASLRRVQKRSPLDSRTESSLLD